MLERLIKNKWSTNQLNQLKHPSFTYIYTTTVHVNFHQALLPHPPDQSLDLVEDKLLSLCALTMCARGRKTRQFTRHSSTTTRFLAPVFVIVKASGKDSSLLLVDWKGLVTVSRGSDFGPVPLCIELCIGLWIFRWFWCWLHRYTLFYSSFDYWLFIQFGLGILCFIQVSTIHSTSFNLIQALSTRFSPNIHFNIHFNVHSINTPPPSFHPTTTTLLPIKRKSNANTHHS